VTRHAPGDASFQPPGSSSRGNVITEHDVRPRERRADGDRRRRRNRYRAARIREPPPREGARRPFPTEWGLDLRESVLSFDTADNRLYRDPKGTIEVRETSDDYLIRQMEPRLEEVTGEVSADEDGSSRAFVRLLVLALALAAAAALAYRLRRG
jgi:hypothetical protein